MLLKDLYRTLDTLVNQDGTDDYFGIDDFNRMIVEEEIALMIDAVEEEKMREYTHRPMTDAILQARTFTADDTGTVYDYELPTGYLRMDSCVYIDANGVKHGVEFISAAEYIRRSSNVLAPPVEQNYICYIEEGATVTPGRWLMFRPVLGTGTWGIFFLGRRTRYINSVWTIVDPFLDYYIDDDGELQFLDEDESLSDYSDGTYRDGTDMNATSGTCATKELYIPVEYHTRLLERLIERLGLKDRDQISLSYGAAKDVQDKQKA